MPFIAARGNTFVKFHIRQGLVLLTIEIAVWLLWGAVWQFYMLWQLVQLGTLVLAIVGIINVTQHKMAQLRGGLLREVF